MYERFTDKARNVMHLANQEAIRCGCDAIETEHILLGLIGADRTVATEVLKNLEVDLTKLRTELEKRMESRPKIKERETAPEPLSQKALDFVIEESRSQKRDYIGTEHLLLGLLREEQGLAAEVLASFGLEIDTVRAEIVRIL